MSEELDLEPIKARLSNRRKPSIHKCQCGHTQLDRNGWTAGYFSYSQPTCERCKEPFSYTFTVNIGEIRQDTDIDSLLAEVERLRAALRGVGTPQGLQQVMDAGLRDAILRYEKAEALLQARCPGCHHRMDGIGGMCALGWCRCVCVDEVEKAENAKESAERPALDTASNKPFKAMPDTPK